jgi:hypothetical protein
MPWLYSQSVANVERLHAQPGLLRTVLMSPSLIAQNSARQSSF